MTKKKLLKASLLGLAIVTPVAIFVSCGSGKSNLRKSTLSYDAAKQPEWMKDLNSETGEFTLDLTVGAFAETKILDSQTPIAALPFTLTSEVEIDGKKVAVPKIVKVSKIIFGTNLEEIKGPVFAGLDIISNIKELVFPADSKLKTIGDYAFEGNQIENLTLPNGVAKIGKGAFKNNKIKTLTFVPTGVTIDDGAFWGNELTEAALPKGNTVSLGKDVFGKPTTTPAPNDASKPAENSAPATEGTTTSNTTN